MKPEKKTVRLDKFLSNSGILSRRGIKQLLTKATVTVNGQRVRESGTRIDATKDTVRINGQLVRKSQHVYYLLNKPKGVISTSMDEFDRDTVVSLIDTMERIYPVGRLDKDTHGLLLLTNDGELTHKLIHPRYHVPKVYLLLIRGSITNQQLKAFRTGVLLDDGITLPAEVTIRKARKDQTLLTVTLHEGRNRQIRRMCETVALELLDLERVAFGPLTLGRLKTGEYRELTKKEIQALKDAVTNVSSSSNS